MAKLTLTDIAAGYNTATAHNANNALIEAAIENTLSRDGTTPNSMNADLDMNGYSILNQLASSGDTNFSWRGNWATGTVYSANNLAYVLVSESAANGGTTYICTADHTAGATFDGDLASYWTLFAKRGGAGAGTGDLLAANNLSDLDNATTARTNLGVAIGTDVQAYDADTTKNDVANTFTKTQTFTKGADVASAAALILEDGNYFDITGTTAITSISTKGVGTTVKLHFDGVLILTHHATDLILPSGANITTAAGDEAEFVEYAAGDWRCTSYTKASGEAVVGTGVLISAEQTVDTTNRSTTSTSFTDSSVSATGTLTNSANKFVITVNGVAGCSTSAEIRFTLYRDAVDLTPSGVNCTCSQSVTGASHTDSFSFVIEDSPGDTSAHTYKLYWRTSVGTAYLGRYGADTSVDAPTTISLEEITV